MVHGGSKHPPGRKRMWRLVRRWVAFNSVGLLGIVVQLAMLLLFTGVIGLHYLLGTALAVGEMVGASGRQFLAHQRRASADRGG